MSYQKKEIAEQLVKEESLSSERACSIVCLARSMWYYKSKNQRDNSMIIDKLADLSKKHSTRSFDNYFGRIRSRVYYGTISVLSVWAN